MQAGDSGETEKSAGFDDIFAPPELESASADSEEQPGATDEKPDTEEALPADEILQKLAAEFGLNPGDAKHKALLDRMVAEQGSAQAERGTAQTPDDDEYERLESLLFEEPPAAEAMPPNGQAPLQGQLPPPPPQGIRFGDVLDDTNSFEEALERYRDAWGEDENGNVDLRKAGATMNAFWMRQYVAMGIPIVQNVISQRLQAEFGDALDMLRKHREQSHHDHLYAGVLERLSKLKGYERIGELFETLSEQNIKVRSESVPDTRINRLLRENPWILDIHRNDRNPDKALQKTHLARFQALVKQWKKNDGSVSLKDAKKLLESGAEIERRKQTDTARQRLNAGPGATSAGGSGKTDDDAWFNSIVKAKGGRAMSVRDLLSSSR
jgi:hypothetical protein